MILAILLHLLLAKRLLQYVLNVPDGVFSLLAPPLGRQGPTPFPIPRFHAPGLDALLVPHGDIGASITQELNKTHVNIARGMMQGRVAVQVLSFHEL